MLVERGQDQAIGGTIAGTDNLAVQHRQLVARDGDLDILVVRFGPEADQPEDAPYEKKQDGGRPGPSAHCRSWMPQAEGQATLTAL